MIKRICKITADIFMAALLPVLMSYMLAGVKLHEWFGTAMFLLFILHHVLNYKWLKNIFHGKYTAVRLAGTIVNISVLLAMLGLMYSGIVLSRYVFTFIPIDSGYANARKLHMICSYWGFILMSLNLGFHWNMFISMGQKLLKGRKRMLPNILPKAIGATMAGYGLYAFQKREIWSYMSLKIQFVFFNMEESLSASITDYLAVMALFVWIGHYTVKILKILNKRKRSELNE